jgi:phosphoribosyl-ATP pyrophosphohydrolase
MFKNLEQLTKTIKKQKNKNSKISYTASLFKKGKNFCIKKFMEEARELAASSKYSNKKNIVHEASDLLYHFLVLLEFKKISITSIMKGSQEFKRRRIEKKMYDKNNIFAKILRGEIPCDKIYEDKFSLAFKDINPQAKVHVLVIPKGAYVDMNDFSVNAKSDEIEGLIRALGKVASILGVSTSGYRYLGNNGRDGGQEVPHLHFHIFGGEKLGRMIHK